MKIDKMIIQTYYFAYKIQNEIYKDLSKKILLILILVFNFAIMLQFFYHPYRPTYTHIYNKQPFVLLYGKKRVMMFMI